MAYTVITANNSSTTPIFDGDADASLFIARDGYIAATGSGGPAYEANGGGALVTIDGALIAGTFAYTSALLLGPNGDYVNGGGNQVTVSAAGLVQGARAITLFGGGNTLVNQGMVRGTGSIASAGNQSAGVALYGDENQITNYGTITGYFGVYSDGADAELTNTGTITGTQSFAVYVHGSMSIRNSGTIQGAIAANDATDMYLLNDGLVSAVYYGAGGEDIIENRGTMHAAITSTGSDRVLNGVNGYIGTVFFGNFGSDLETDRLSNFGTINNVQFDDSSDNVQNSGRIIAGLDMLGGDNVVTNTGVIGSTTRSGGGKDVITNQGTLGDLETGAGDDWILNTAGASIRMHAYLGASGSADADVLINDGTIGIDLDPLLAGLPTVTFGDGADVLRNSGVIRGLVDMGADGAADSVVNTGRIEGGLLTGGGDDSVDNSLGRIDGIVTLGDGSDSYAGGDAVDRVSGGERSDVIDLAGGNDRYFATKADGNDQVDGGDGIDTYDASNAALAVTIDLGAGTTAGTIGVDDIASFENAIGGRGNDALVGSDDANRLDGNAGNDTVDGGAGNDRLFGGLGRDTLTGGVGKDVMRGGDGADTFVFDKGDSGVTAATRDVIVDFTDHGSAAAPFAAGADTIDLSLIDANTTVTGNQAFTFNATQGAAFSGTAGELIWVQKAGFALISGDTNGDKIADFTIQLGGTHTLFASDFVL